MQEEQHYEKFATHQPITTLDPSLSHNKSNRPWKLGLNTKNQKITSSNPGMKLSWEEKKARKAEMQNLRDKLKDYRTKKIEKKKLDKEKRKEKKREKELNALKAGTFEVIKDPKKIKKWNKRIRDQLVKLPAEMFENLINSRS